MKKLSDEQLDELLDELNVMARNYDYECGLPMYSDEEKVKMRKALKSWFKKVSKKEKLNEVHA